MKTGRYTTLRKIFKDYNQNKKILKNYPLPSISGVDYTKPRVTPDKTQNAQEMSIISALDRKSDLERSVRLVDEVMRWFVVEGYGRERYIKLRLVDGLSEIVACERIGISERTGRYWKRDIFGKAEIIGESIGIFKEKK